MKKTVQIGVKMSESDFTLLRKAAAEKWPDAEITNAGVVLALAKISARQILTKKTNKK